MKPDTDHFYSRLHEDYAVLSIQGEDATTFLQGQVTCDVAEINAEQSRYGAICNPKGRALTTFRLLSWNDGFLMILPMDLVEAITKRLQMYVLRSKVSLNVVTDAFHVIGLSGKACQHVTPLVDTLSADTCISSDESIAIRLPSPQARLLWLVSKKATGLLDSLNDTDEQPTSVWRLNMISDGIPHLCAQTQELFVPQMINLDALGGINFKKGCYTGQEIVARMHYLGKLKKRMYLFRHQESIQPGTRLFSAADNSNSAGTVVNCEKESSDSHLLLAVCQINIAEDGLLIPENSSTFTESVPLPYELQSDG